MATLFLPPSTSDPKAGQSQITTITITSSLQPAQILGTFSQSSGSFLLSTQSFSVSVLAFLSVLITPLPSAPSHSSFIPSFLFPSLIPPLLFFLLAYLFVYLRQSFSV